MLQMRIPIRRPGEKGVVYTNEWVVDLILDLVGYRPEADLATLVAVEPAAGEGAFLIPMVRRLLASLREHERPFADARRSIRAYELDDDALLWARDFLLDELLSDGVPRGQAARLARGWLVQGDYLLDAPDALQADVVVGNPPYIRYDDIPEDLYTQYRDACPTMTGRCDIYVGFIETALKQIKPGGRLGFICADRWMRSAYGSKLRELVATGASVEAVIEMHNAPAFADEVSAYPAVIVVRRGEQGPVVVGSANEDAGALADGSLADAVHDLAARRRDTLPGFSASDLKGWYDGNGPWPWAKPEELEVLQWLEARHGPLEDTATGTKVGIGVATGADQVFVTKDAEGVEEDRLLPLAMVEDTKDGTLRWSGHYLVNPWLPDGSLVELAAFPGLAAYFQGRADELRGRNIAKRHTSTWHRTIDKVTYDLLGHQKLYFPDMKMESHPVLDRGETYPHHNLYWVTSDVWDMELLGGILLSKVAELFIASYCVKMRGGTLRFQAQYLRRIRVPRPEHVADDVADALRQAFRDRDRAAATDAAIEAYGLPELARDLW
jgi:hypothetical protein